MKRLFFLFIICFFFGGCQSVDNEIASLSGGVGGKITLTSDMSFTQIDGQLGELYDRLHHYFVDIPSSGATFTVIASFPEEDGVPLNDSFVIGLGSTLIPNNQVTVDRKRINQFQSSYSITVEPNTIGIPYEIYILLIDDTRTDKTGQHYESNATLVIRQGV